jgi:hypothetical protein
MDVGARGLSLTIYPTSRRVRPWRVVYETPVKRLPRIWRAFRTRSEAEAAIERRGTFDGQRLFVVEPGDALNPFHR